MLPFDRVVCQLKYGREAEMISYIDLLYLSLSLSRKYKTFLSQVAVQSWVSGMR